MKTARIIILSVIIFPLLACAGKKDVVQLMLDKAIKGEETGEYWVGGTAKQKLYNVIDYEIMSERPLNETLRQYLPKATQHYELSLDASEKAIAEYKDTILKIRDVPPKLEKLASVSILDQVENDFEGNLNRMSQALKYIHLQFPEEEFKQAESEIKSATEAYGRFEICSQKKDEYCMRKSLWDAMSLTRDSYSSFKSVVEDSRKRFEKANQLLRDIPARINSENDKIKKYRTEMAQLENLVNNAKGVAYKVKINSTNKAGQPIVWIWTITVVDSGQQPKVSYIYNEENFNEELDSRSLQLALMSVIHK